MELVIPDGAQVHITVGQPPLLALPHDARATAPSSERQRGRVTKGILAGVLLIGAFQAGRLLPHHADMASAAPPAAAIAPGATEGSAGGELPPAFRAQMAQPPQVVPPPGAGPAAAPGAPASGPAAPAPPNPFGLKG